MSKASNQGSSAIYGMGFLGAIVFYMQQADGFWSVIVGILKAIIWPAFLVYDLLQFVAS